MNWINYSNLKGSHALISPSSSFRWLDYDEDHIVDAIYSTFATKRGTALHELACKMIKYNIKMNKSDRHMVQMSLMEANIPPSVMDIPSAMDVLVPYVNDCIGFRMDPEVVLYFSDYCYGTTDAISYDEGMLRIHDLKTGTTPPHIEQLMSYAALFSLNYNESPKKFQTELRIYKKDEILVHNPSSDEIQAYIDKIKKVNEIANKIYG